MSQKFYCRVDSSLDFGFLYSNWLLDGDTVANSTWTVTPEASTKSPHINDSVILRDGIEHAIGTCTSIYFSASAPGDYVLTNAIVTTQGRQERFDLKVSVLA